MSINNLQVNHELQQPNHLLNLLQLLLILKQLKLPLQKQRISLLNIKPRQRLQYGEFLRKTQRLPIHGLEVVVADVVEGFCEGGGA